MRDRKHENVLMRRSFIGSEAVDWLTRVSPIVHGRFHANAMLQALLEAGVIVHGKNWYLTANNFFLGGGVRCAALQPLFRVVI